MPTFVDHLDEEIASLEHSLAVDPRYIKLRELRRVRELYAGMAPAKEAGPDSRNGGERKPSRELAPESRQALAEAEALLTGRSEPTPMRQIFHHLVEVKGCKVGGRDPMNGLSALLSRSHKFVAHGRAGWTLADAGTDTEPAKSETPNSGELFGAPKRNGAEPLHQ